MKSLIKFAIVYLFIQLTFVSTPTSAQQWDWVKTFGGSGKCIAYDATTDNDGNIIVAGSFTGTVFFNNTKLVNDGIKDFFIAKYDTDGNLIWVKQSVSNKDNEAYGVVCDKSGNIFITGYFSGLVKLSDNISINSENEKNCFVIKYDKNGMFIWASRTNGVFDKYGKDLTIDKNGNILITGVFKNDISFFYEDEITGIDKGDNNEDKETERSFTLNSKGASDIFIAKYSCNNELLWAKQSDGDGTAESASIKSDNKGNSYITGYFTNTCSFGEMKLISKGGKDIIVVKYDSTGNVIWANQPCKSETDMQSCGMNIDKNNNIFLTGYFSGTAIFGKTKLESKNNDDIFISKMDYNGNALWAKQAGGTGNEYGREIVSGSDGNIYITGGFNSGFDFGTSKISNAGDWDIFVLKFDSQGNALNGFSAGSKGSDKAIGLVVNDKNKIFVLGSISGSANFNGNIIKSKGDNDDFVAKIK